MVFILVPTIRQHGDAHATVENHPKERIQSSDVGVELHNDSSNVIEVEVDRYLVHSLGQDDQTEQDQGPGGHTG